MLKISMHAVEVVLLLERQLKHLALNFSSNDGMMVIICSQTTNVDYQRWSQTIIILKFTPKKLGKGKW